MYVAPRHVNGSPPRDWAKIMVGLRDHQPSNIGSRNSSSFQTYSGLTPNIISCCHRYIDECAKLLPSAPREWLSVENSFSTGDTLNSWIWIYCLDLVSIRLMNPKRPFYRPMSGRRIVYITNARGNELFRGPLLRLGFVFWYSPSVW